MSKYKVYDWAGNDMDSPEFDHFDDAVEWIDTAITNLYGDIDDNEYEEEFSEYVIHDVTADEDLD